MTKPPFSLFDKPWSGYICVSSLPTGMFIVSETRPNIVVRIALIVVVPIVTVEVPTVVAIVLRARPIVARAIDVTRIVLTR